MANHQIPRSAERVETLFGIDGDGELVRLVVFKHRRAGHQHPMFYVLQYRELSRRIDRATRTTVQFTGPDAEARLDAEGLAVSRPLFEATRIRAAKAAR